MDQFIFSDRVGRRKTVLLSLYTLSISMIGFLISSTLSSYLPLMGFVIAAGLSAGGQGKLALPLEVLGAR